ncbi:hypothetical protein BCR33DRAFT_846234 [Rhizoclosmatium globosum]|uniref:DUF4436 domain-containing protein n=1 Tax=Rhizoclosmatium globosum TaxID=329046 RepID=A0A1Y2CYM1_9FUNG|nr:hypothetical protein BCR33DRAFT_846234 [Rhizoclosmatium globosum]|eukprot:ORY51435.1 hypothetical protein BCR33DRAFT_846234 [Rhizoclosmatium globosum]
MKITPKQKLVIVAVGIALYFGIIISGLTTIGISAKKASKGKGNYYVTSNTTLANAYFNNDQNLNFMTVEAVMVSVDIPKSEARVMLYFSLNGLLNSGITGTYPQSPFSMNIPMNLLLDGMPAGFSVSYDTVTLTDADTHTEIYSVGNVIRTQTCRTVAIFIAILMWSLCLACSPFTASMFVFNKKAEGSYLGFHTALLFALPSIRNAMPLAPPIGSLIDQMVLVWNMMILALCVLCQFLRLITQVAEGGYKKILNPDDKEEEKKEEKKPLTV